MEAAFDFLRYQITDMDYHVITEKETNSEHQVETEIGIQRNNEDPSVFRLAMKLSLHGNVEIKLSVYGYFKWRNEYVVDETEASIMVSGTAILYPYARATISTISCLDGSSAIMLQTINPYDLFPPKKIEIGESTDSNL